MGIYKIHWLQIAEAINYALDNIEGDYGKKEFKRAMDFMKNYGYLCDCTEKETLDWEKYRERFEEKIK